MTIKEMETIAGRHDEAPQEPHPWRRFFARVLDFNLYDTLISLVLVLRYHVNLAQRGSGALFGDFLLGLLLMLLVEPLFLRLWGTTPGKWIFGIRLQGYGDNRPTYGQGFVRTWRVLSRGMGFNIPIYRLYRLWKSYKACSQGEMLPWEEELSLTIRDTRWYRGLLAAGAYAGLVAMLAAAMAWVELPPNRGNLTVAQFAQNYNYLADYLDVQPAYRLDEQGKWHKRRLDAYTYPMAGIGMPPKVFTYTVEDGMLKEVAFQFRAENTEDWVDLGRNQMALAALSFAGAQKELGVVDPRRRRMVEQISQGELQNGALEVAGVKITCRVESQGFVETDFGLLVPLEEGEPNPCTIEFSMAIQ